ncbi:RusA family crossover junction endodeoxyribonuclease [Ligilactobacillus salivarius]|uniref:RusA family crossover junction endodeoxyribonuclease n=1 Tax=Ligilactobacillus salivarius TaxID=1624 RepID=UPI00237D3BAC|nr:RusA family crossover junction endodeoxyribonuclease [Ligilactobacillus salivarius]MDE1525067.1 RusA family crossover junction endodeoxyribonuclease [Ligilactobacillus salivarius]
MQQTMELTFNIEPQQQERPRATGRGRFIRVYDPPKTAKFKRELKQLAVGQMQGKDKFNSAISVTIRFFRKVQKSVSKKEHARRTQGHVRPIVKPDLDNYIKSTLDALNGVIWTDDATIVELNTSKWYADDPRIEIEVKEI